MGEATTCPVCGARVTWVEEIEINEDGSLSGVYKCHKCGHVFRGGEKTFRAWVYVTRPYEVIVHAKDEDEAGLLASAGFAHGEPEAEEIEEVTVEPL